MIKREKPNDYEQNNKVKRSDQIWENYGSLIEYELVAR
jgi:hypothetical protein